MGREIRRVTITWEHPRKDNGEYQPMFNEYYGDAINEWIKNHNKWQDGTHSDLIKEPERKDKYPFYAMWNGGPPDVEYYQTKQYKDEELTHIQLYENTTEGTPTSPVFKADEFEKLCEWASENATTFADYKASKERWMEMLGNNNVHHTEGNITFI